MTLMKTLPTLWLLAALLMAGFASAAEDTYKFNNEVDRKRFQSFVEEMRCPKCQNQNLADSDSPISEDLRREIYEMIQDDRSDKEIVDALVDSYGQYILYRPPLNASTWALWFFPVALLLVGIVVLIWIAVRRRQGAQDGTAGVPGKDLDAAERARLEALLNSESSDQKNRS